MKKRDVLIRKLQAVKLTPGGKLPDDAIVSLNELANLAVEIMRTQEKAIQKLQAQVTKSQKVGVRQARKKYVGEECGKYNTWWNALKTLVGVCSEFEECMYVGWRVDVGLSDSQNAYTDCKPEGW